MRNSEAGGTCVAWLNTWSLHLCVMGHTTRLSPGKESPMIPAPSQASFQANIPPVSSPFPLVLSLKLCFQTFKQGLPQHCLYFLPTNSTSHSWLLLTAVKLCFSVYLDSTHVAWTSWQSLVILAIFLLLPYLQSLPISNITFCSSNALSIHAPFT